MPTQNFSAVVATPGTPQRITSATVPAQAALTGALAGSLSVRGNSIIFQAAPSNTASKSIFIGGPTMNVAAKTGIGNVLTPGQFSPSIYISGTSDLGDFWIDTDSATAANERVYVMVTG